MGASAGRYAVGIGSGAASGAGLGAFGGPPGAIIGGVIGGGLGALSTLLSSSDEAKEREKQRQLYLQQQRGANESDYERRYLALHPGLAQDPMYIAQGYQPFDEKQANATFDAGMPDEPPPNYAALAQRLGSLGTTVGTLNRQSALDDKLGLAKINSSGNPWEAYASESEDPMQQLLERSRQAAWNRTGGW